MDKNKYLNYINEHINNINQVLEDITPYLIDEYYINKNDYIKIVDLICSHDKSKFSDEEFYGYCQYFNATKEDEEDEIKFKKSWNHHQKNNPHHWEYWLLYEDGNIEVLEMDFIYIFEMLCDWTAMSYKFEDIPGDFYKKNKEEIILGKKTREIVEFYLPIFDIIAENNINNKKGD